MPTDTDTLAAPILPIPTTAEAALDPAWLTAALAPMSRGSEVIWVGDIDNFETMAAKIRLAVKFANDPETKHHLCLKAFLSNFAPNSGITQVREAKFYERLAPHLGMRVPKATAVFSEDGTNAVLIMEDLIVAGARFCSALEPFTPEIARGSLDQIARLHAGSYLLPDNNWIPTRLDFIADVPYLSDEVLQELMDGPRCAPLNDRTSSAVLLKQAMKALRDRFRDGPKTILHGDCHAGNFYMTAEGPGLTDWQLISRGSWAQDVAYHINAVLPIEVAVAEERGLVQHYLERVATHGGTPPAFDQAWEDYRAAQVYGYYHWAITRKVDPRVTETFCQRLGAGIERHDTYDLLGL